MVCSSGLKQSSFAVSCLQVAQPLAAKLLSGAQNASYQANATRNAAKQAVLEAQHKLAALKEQLKAAKDSRQAAKQVFKGLPAQWGKSQFKVGVWLGVQCCSSERRP